MILAKKRVHEMLPQKPPFVMVDNLLKADLNGIETDFFIDAENILYDISRAEFTAPGLIENIAQSCAAGFGEIDADKGEKSKVGFIGSISKMKVHRKPQKNSTINTRVVILNSFENIFLVKGESFYNDEILLECEMKIVIVE